MSTEIYLGYPPENIKKWIEKNYKLKNNYLCFTAEEAGSTIKMIKEGNAPTVYLETSPTGEEGSWTDFTICTINKDTYEVNSDGTTITLPNIGDKVYFRAKQDNERFATSDYEYNAFKMTGKIAASGNLNTLLKADGSVLDLMTDDIDRSYCYYNIFGDCSSLTQAPELPATELADSCYSNMFSGCTSLTQAPELPATELADSCYNNMFSRCSSLTQAPELKAETLTENCYEGMFEYCTALTKAPELSATNLARWCYSGMFQGCTSLTQAPELPAETLADSCYGSMFYGCASLTSAPELFAKTLANRCYNLMFRYCTSLTLAPKLSATTLAYECYFGMFLNSAIPSFTVDMTACTSVPSLPSTTLFGIAGKPYTVLIPASLYDEWIQADNWSSITTNIQAV